MLERNVKLNQIGSLVSSLNVGAGASRGELTFSQDMDTTNRVVPEANGQGFLRVPVLPLDEICGGQAPICMKVDVEGFEQAVIEGGDQTLRSEGLLAVIMETNGACRFYGFNELELYRKMTEHYGFTPWKYDPEPRRLARLGAINTSGNTLFLRNVEQIRDRLRQARGFQVRGQMF